MAELKKISLAVACRYLRRYKDTGAHLVCRHHTVPIERPLYPTLLLADTSEILSFYTPEAKVFLIREDASDVIHLDTADPEAMIAEITHGLPPVRGNLELFTGAFLRGLHY